MPCARGSIRVLPRTYREGNTDPAIIVTMPRMGSIAVALCVDKYSTVKVTVMTKVRHQPRSCNMGIADVATPPPRSNI